MSRRLFVQGSGTKKAIDHLRMFRCSYIRASLSLPEVAPPRQVSPPRFVPLQGRVAIALLPRLSDCIHHCQQRAARDCKCHKKHPNHQGNPRSQWQVRKRLRTLGKDRPFKCPPSLFGRRTFKGQQLWPHWMDGSTVHFPACAPQKFRAYRVWGCPRQAPTD